jgi:hypothetical protein
MSIYKYKSQRVLQLAKIVEASKEGTCSLVFYSYM